VPRGAAPRHAWTMFLVKGPALGIDVGVHLCRWSAVFLSITRIKTRHRYSRGEKSLQIGPKIPAHRLHPLHWKSFL